MSDIKLLDCSLRDGGHINSGNFGGNIIKAIISDLVRSRIDIIEAGFLWDSSSDTNTAHFYNISELKKILPKDLGVSKIALMADNVDLSHLENNDGTVEYIRLSFRKNEFDWVKSTSGMLMDKGYKVFVNPIHGSALSDREYIDIINEINKLHPFGFSIVDTFGALRQSDLGRIYFLVEHNLDKEITLGVHLHKNLGLEYSLAQYILSILSPKRNIVIDGSLYGIGKVPGNLCIEQIVDYLNHTYGFDYSIEPIYDAIDNYIMPIYEKTKWGYSIPYALSAQYSVHRSYAEFLLNKKQLTTKIIKRLLGEIDSSHAEIYDEEYIDNIYKIYMNVEYNDVLDIQKFKEILAEVEEIIIVCPGSSVKNFDFKGVTCKKSFIVCVNFICNQLVPDRLFLTSLKRLVDIENLSSFNVAITSNLIREASDYKMVFSRNDLIYHGNVFCDDSTIMLINLLHKIGIRKLSFVGFDGFAENKENFYDSSYERTLPKKDYDVKFRKNILMNIYSDVKKEFLTPSLYGEEKNKNEM